MSEDYLRCCCEPCRKSPGLQDFFYLGAYLESYATALERVDAEADPETHAVISRLHRACQDETGLHSAYCAKWGVDPTVAEPSEPCLAYVNFLLGVVRSGAPVHEILVAMLPCTRLYAWLGRLMLLADGQRNQYGAWVMNYGTEDFQVRRLRFSDGLHTAQMDTVAMRGRSGSCRRRWPPRRRR